MRTYLLNWLMGVQRCYWYAWDNHNWSTLDLTSAPDNRITGAGAAYGILRGWLLGSVLRSCERERDERVGLSDGSFRLDQPGAVVRYTSAFLHNSAVLACDQDHGLDRRGQANHSQKISIGAAPVLLSSD